MDSNRLILIALASISLLLITPKLKKHSLGLIAITILVGFSVTRDIVQSVSVALILGTIFTSLCNVPSRARKKNHLKVEREKEKVKEKEQLMMKTKMKMMLMIVREK